MKNAKKAIYLAICLALASTIGLLFGCGGQTQQASQLSASSGSGAEKTPSVSADDIQAMEGTWEVRGIYYKGNLIDISDVDGLEDLYDTTMLTFNDDGTFVYLNKFGNRGSWSRENPENGNKFVLKTESSFRYTLEKGSLTEKEVDSSKSAYLVELLDENTATYIKYDESTGKSDEEDEPLVFVKQGSESAYLAENKTPVSTKKESGNSSASSSSSISNSSSSSAAGTTAEHEKSTSTTSKPTGSTTSTDSDDDFKIVESGYDDANGKGYKGSDGNYYFKDNDGSYMATDGKGNGVKDVDGDGEADYYTTDSGETWHSL